MENIQLNFELLAEQTRMWKKTLAALQQQNIAQKNKLSAVMRTENQKRILLEQAEYYQNCFLQQDDTVRIMRNEIAALEGMIAGNRNRLQKNLAEQEDKMELEIQRLQINFNKLSDEFTNFLQQVNE